MALQGRKRSVVEHVLVRGLEDAGLIVGYRALLDAKKLGLTLMALIGISMDQHTPERFTNFEAKIAEIPEVLESLGSAMDVFCCAIFEINTFSSEAFVQVQHKWQRSGETYFDIAICTMSSHNYSIIIIYEFSF